MQAKPLIRDELTDQLRGIAVSMRAKQPVRIEAERELARRLQVSRLSVRVAIKNLVDEGLLVQRQGSGTYIIPEPETGLTAIDLLVAHGIKPKDPFYHEFLDALSKHLAHEGLLMRIVNPNSIAASIEDAPLIILGLESQQVVAEAKSLYSHVVAVQSYPDSLDLTQVYFDDFRIGYHAATILMDSGHETLIHLQGPDRYPSADERMRGFRQAADQRGATAHAISGKMNWQSGHELGDQVLPLLEKTAGVAGVFAANDWMALGLLHRLKEAGLEIPRDLSLIGCDDIHLAIEITPQLATFRWDMDFMIAELFSVLNAEIETGPSPARRILLPAEFVERESLKQRN